VSRQDGAVGRCLDRRVCSIPGLQVPSELGIAQFFAREGGIRVSDDEHYITL
jgi:hypothetical protein